jgi:hypothetical protein
MNSTPNLPTPCWLFLVALCCLLAVTADAFAADSVATLSGSTFLDLVSNRSRMIQVSLIFVAVGCSLLWWRR